MNFISNSSFTKKLKVSPNSIKKIRDENKIPFMQRGKKYFYLENYETICENREIIKNDNTCNVITIGNNKGGVNKTTAVINISSTLAFYGFNVLMIDMDMQSNLSRHFNKNELYDNIANKLDSLDDTVINLQHKAYNYGKLDLIVNDLSMATQFSGFDDKKLSKLLKKLSNKYDFIILDTPPNIVDITPQCLLVSDYAFMCLKPDPYSTSGAINFLNLIQKSKVSLLGGVISTSNKRIIADSVNIKKIEDIFLSANSKICDTQISNSSIFNETTLMKEHSILTYQPNHKCCDEYLLITNFIINKVIKDILND